MFLLKYKSLQATKVLADKPYMSRLGIRKNTMGQLRKSLIIQYDSAHNDICNQPLLEGLICF